MTILLTLLGAGLVVLLVWLSVVSWKSMRFKKESIESIAGVEGNQPLPMKEINPSPYIESKEEIKDIIFKMPLISLGSHVKIKQKDYDEHHKKFGTGLENVEHYKV